MGPEEEKRNKEDDTEDKQENETKGITEGALRGLGKLIPGFGDFVNGLENSDVFQERLRDTDAELERKLKNDPPLKRTGERRNSIIPPKTTLRAMGGTPKHESRAGWAPQREVIADVFDEGGYLKVIAELPGLDKRDVIVEARGTQLILSAQTTERRYYKEVDLPCPVKGKPSSTYNNGILQITLEKDRER